MPPVSVAKLGKFGHREALGAYSSSAARNGPYGPRCLALQSPDATMAGLTPPTVVAAAIALLEGSGAR